MRPELWTIPGINYTVRTYGLVMMLGFLLALWIAVRRGKRAGFDPAAFTSIAIIGGFAGVIGSRAVHFLHYSRDQLGTGSVTVAEAAVSGGAEVLGGIVLAVLGAIVYLAVTKKPILAHLDIAFPSIILGMGIGRIGCLTAGCCWGQICETPDGGKALPWAIRFPYGSPAHLQHWKDSRIEIPAELVWSDPFAKRATPMPPEVLADDSWAQDRALATWVEKAEHVAEIQRATPESPDLGKLREELHQLRAGIAGRSEYEVAAALHLRRLAEHGTSSEPGARSPAVANSLSQLRALAATQHSRWVHPTQLYDAIGLILMFFVLSAILRRSGRPGRVVAWTLLLYPVSRFLQETLRADNPHDVFGLTISQAASIAIFALGVIVLLFVSLKPQPDKVPAAS